MAWEDAEQAAVDREDCVDMWPNVSLTGAELSTVSSGDDDDELSTTTTHA